MPTISWKYQIRRNVDCWVGCFSKDTLKKNKMSTPPHNWGVPRKIISRRRGWSNKSRGLALALKVWPFFASFHLPPSGSVVPLAIFSSTYCFAEIKVKSWEVEHSKKEVECDAEVNFNYCSPPAHLPLTSYSPHHPLIPFKNGQTLRGQRTP